MICGWCAGKDQTCRACSSGKRPFFPKKARKRIDDTLPTAACKHGRVEEVLTPTKYLCACGAVVKVAN